MDKTVVDRATAVAFADGGPDRVRAVVIVHGGAIVYERYSPSATDGPEVVMPSYSMAKSVTAALIGILVRDGRLELEQPALVPEWHENPDDLRSAITVQEMLHMSTGMEWSDGMEPGTDMTEIVMDDDAAAYAAAQTLTWATGERFEYNSGTTTLLARMVGNEADGDASETREFMDEELFDVIGMDPVHSTFDPAGTWMGSYSADTTARNYAKFGLLHLRGASGMAPRSCPPNGSTSSGHRARPTRSTGGHWWLDPEHPGMFHAIGIRGNVITVDPAHDLVIVQLGTVPGPLPLAHFEAIYEAFATAGP